MRVVGKKARDNPINKTRKIEKSKKPKRERDEYILFLDNLHGHQCDEYRQCARENNIFLWFTPPDTTDLCAVNDHHIGQMVKRLVKKRFL